MDAQLVDWLLDSDEPWTRYRTLVDLLDAPADSAEIMQARNEMLAHPMVKDLMQKAAAWPGATIKRHNDAKLTLLPWACTDARLAEMLDAITVQADEEGRYTATSMYMAWKSWPFANKKQPSPWLTFLVARLQHRLEMSRPC